MALAGGTATKCCQTDGLAAIGIGAIPVGSGRQMPKNAFPTGEMGSEGMG
jgi:hypothetical protein